MKKNTNKKLNTGITLIALVITIVVLSILAAITINLTLGDNGILKRAKTAKEKYQNAEGQEQLEIAKTANEIDNFVGGNRNNEELQYFKTRIANVLTASGINTSPNDSIDTIIQNISSLSTRKSNDFTLLYYRGNEYEDITEGWEFEKYSTNDYYTTSNPVWFEGDANNSSGSIERTENSINIRAVHANPDGYCKTKVTLRNKKAIDLTEYSNLFITLSYSCDSHENASGALYIYDDNNNCIKSASLYDKICEVDISDLSGNAFIEFYLNSGPTRVAQVSANITRIGLEK